MIALGEKLTISPSFLSKSQPEGQALKHRVEVFLGRHLTKMIKSLMFKERRNGQDRNRSPS